MDRLNGREVDSLGLDSGNREHGGIIISVLIVAGAAVLIAGGLVQLVGTSFKAMRGIKQAAEIDRTTSIIKIALGNSDVCRYNLTVTSDGKASNLRVPAINETVALDSIRPLPSALGERVPYLKTKQAIDGVRVMSLGLRRWGQNEEDAILDTNVRIAEIVITYERQERDFLGYGIVSRHIPVALEVDGSERIISCRTPGEAFKSNAASSQPLADQYRCKGEYVETISGSDFYDQIRPFHAEQQVELQSRQPIPTYHQALEMVSPNADSGQRGIASVRAKFRMTRARYKGVSMPVVQVNDGLLAIPTFDEGDSFTTGDPKTNCLRVFTCIHARLANTGVSCLQTQATTASTGK